jgi:hypothetical protein
MDNIEKEAYQKHKNLKLAADELGVKWQTLYVHLRQAGVPVLGDKSRYGSDKDRFAAKAEDEFKRLIPGALSQNEIQFQAKIDFLVGNEKVDIKSSSLKYGCKGHPNSMRWSFSIKKQAFCADFLVCFAFLNEGYRLFLFPGETVRNYQTITIPQKGGKWSGYEINPEELSEFFVTLQNF